MMNDLNVNEESFKKTFKSSFDQIQNIKKKTDRNDVQQTRSLENGLKVLAIYYYSIYRCVS